MKSPNEEMSREELAAMRSRADRFNDCWKELSLLRGELVTDHVKMIKDAIRRLANAEKRKDGP